MTSDERNDNQMAQDTLAERDFFDQAAEAQAHGYFSRAGWRRLAALVREFVPDKKRVCILDLGCGTGHLFAHLAPDLPDATLVGVDISERSIELARSRGTGTFLVGDIRDLDLTERFGPFDVVVLSSVLHHFEDPRIAVRCAKRHLAPDGHIVSYDPNSRNPFFFAYRSPLSPISSRAGLSPNERLMSRRDLEAAFQSEGFALDSFGVSGISFSWVYSPFARRLMPVFNFLDTWLFQDTLIEEPFGCFRVCVTRPSSRQAEVACLACQSHRLKRLYLMLPQTFYRCMDCGTLFARPLAATESHTAEYHSKWHNELYSQYYSQLRVAQSRAILDELDRLGKRPLDILDVGCGYGYFVQEARNRGHSAKGIDVSLPDDAYLACQGVLSRQPLAELVKAGERFDAVCLLTVLEHVKEPELLLVEIAGLLRTGGLLVISIPTVEPFTLYWILHLLFRISAGTIRWPWRTLLQWGTPAPHVFIPTRNGLLTLTRRCMPSEPVVSFGQPMTYLRTLLKRVKLEAERTGCGRLKQVLMYIGGLFAHSYDLLTIKLGCPSEVVTVIKKTGAMH